MLAFPHHRRGAVRLHRTRYHPHGSQRCDGFPQALWEAAAMGGYAPTALVLAGLRT